MAMKLMGKVREKAELTDYAISKDLTRRGIEITIPGVNGYSKPNAKSMRLDVLCGLRQLTGLSWNEFGKWLDDEFLPKK